MIGHTKKQNCDEEYYKTTLSNHEWNYVKLNEKWHIIDSCWGAGSSIEGKWQMQFNDY